MTTLEPKVEELLSQFNEWFVQKKNDPLVKGEKAILKTFCWWIAHEKPVIVDLEVTIKEPE